MRAQEVNMQSPAPNGYRSTRRFEGAADPERGRRTPKRADELNMQSPTPNGYSTRFESAGVDPERENFNYENSSKRTTSNRVEVNERDGDTK